MSYPFETASDLPIVIDPDDPSRKRPAREMTHFVLFLTPEETAKVENLAARAGIEVGELGIRALAYGLTVLEAIQQQDEHRRLNN